jgi:outer membrane protein OmpA-like peptidoglycan-associated protein
MNTFRKLPSASPLVAAAVVSVLLAACASAPSQPAGAAEVRARLTQLQSNPDLASRATPVMKEAEAAVRAAEAPEKDKALAAHRVFMADRKVATARAGAEAQFAEDQRKTLSEQRERSRLEARTREADNANAAAAAARADSAQQRIAADDARGAASAAEDATRNAEQQSAKLQLQLDAMNARPTDRGLVLTLGDVLFTSGRADLKSEASGNLNRLVTFLNEYPMRTVVIEGFTDSIGSEDANQGLSQRRADSVKSYLVGQGIESLRLTAQGKGEGSPVADNGSESGRRQNRRVDVIISNTPLALR